MGEITPSENEWAIMEIVWKSADTVTAADIIRQLAGVLDISDKTVRVMINRLVAKGVLDYEVDDKDARIYHYHALRTKEECLKLKNKRYVKNYFGGDASLAVASFIRSADITPEELSELKKMIEEM